MEFYLLSFALLVAVTACSRLNFDELVYGLGYNIIYIDGLVISIYSGY